MCARTRSSSVDTCATSKFQSYRLFRGQVPAKRVLGEMTSGGSGHTDEVRYSRFPATIVRYHPELPLVSIDSPAHMLSLVSSQVV
jgi:hypothetical protein